MSERLTGVSLFAGVGGFDLAMERAGIDVVAAVEIDDRARGVLKHRFPEAALFTDIKGVSGDQLRSAGFVPERGVLTGGFPCQDLSVAGKRAGLAGARSGLFFEFARLIEETGVRWIVVENVPGLLSSNGGRDMGTVVGTLADLGYGLAWRVLDSQYFGLAQRRKRLVLVGRSGEEHGARAASEVLALEEGVRGDPAPSRPSREGAAGGPSGGARGGMTSFVKATRHRNAETWREDEVSPTLNLFDNGGDARATVIAFAQNQREEVRDLDGVSTALTAEPGTHQTTYVAAYSVREDAQAGNFSANEVDVANALQAYRASVQSHHAQTFVAELVPIQDGREIEKAQNGLGVGDSGDPSYTIDTTGSQAVAFQLSGDRSDPRVSVSDTTAYCLPANPMSDREQAVMMIGFSHTQGLDAQPSETVFPTLRSEGGGQAIAYDDALSVQTANGGMGGPIHKDGVSWTVQPHPTRTAVMASSVVRRLTPLECERLQGFHDDWTAQRWDWKRGELVDQADSARYHQMGNAVSVPVFEWVLRRIAGAA